MLLMMMMVDSMYIIMLCTWFIVVLYNRMIYLGIFFFILKRPKQIRVLITYQNPISEISTPPGLSYMKYPRKMDVVCSYVCGYT